MIVKKYQILIDFYANQEDDAYMKRPDMHVFQWEEMLSQQLFKYILRKYNYFY